MAKMNWTRVRWEQRTRTHGSESVANDPPPPSAVFDQRPKLEKTRKGIAKPTTIKSKKKASAQMGQLAGKTARPELPGSLMLLMRAIDSWSHRDPLMTGCDNRDLSEILQTVKALRSRVNNEIRRRAQVSART
jgi:hypothetical protein